MMEVKSALGRITLGPGSNKTMLEILNSNILHVETNIVIGKGLLESFMVHLLGTPVSTRPTRTVPIPPI